MFKKITNYLAALEIGTTKITGLIGELDELGNINVKGLGSGVFNGLKKNGLEDPVEVTASIKRAMLRAERMAGVVAEQCLLSFSGSFIRLEIGESELELGSDFLVHEEDPGQLIDHIGGQLKKNNEKILHLIPLNFQVDGQDFSTPPVGEMGKVFKARVLAVLAVEDIFSQIVKCCQRAGIKVAQVVWSVLAGFEALSESLQEKNILLIDCQGKCTAIGFFRNGVLSGGAVIGFGGNHITSDIAYGLEVSPAEAERIKILFGTAEKSETGETEFLNISEKELLPGSKKISGKFLGEIIDSRLREIFKQVKNEIEKMPNSQLIEEVVLSGGGSLLRGIEKTAEKVLNLSVEKGSSRFIDELVSSPIYATASGLIFYGIKRELVKPPVVTKNFFYQMVGETKRWFQEFF